MRDAGGAATDLTGATFEMDVRDGAGAEIFSATTENARILITEAAAGSFAIDVPAALMATVPPGDYAHDLLLRQAGRVTRVWVGGFAVIQGVSA